MANSWKRLLTTSDLDKIVMRSDVNNLTEKTTLVDNDLGVITDSEASNQNKQFKFSSLWTYIKTKCSGHGSGVDADMVDGLHSDNLIVNGNRITTNSFGGKHLYQNILQDAIFRAESRWIVTGKFYNISDDSLYSDVTPYIGTLFDGDYESALTIPLGKYLKIHINFNAGYFLGYPYGDIIASYYYIYSIASMKLRVYCNYEPHGIGWHEVNGYYAEGSFYARNDRYNISEMEIIIVGQSTGDATLVSNIEWRLDRPGNCEMPFIDKYKQNFLYSSLVIKTPANVSPLVVTSNTLVENLNADKWDNNEFADFLDQAVRKEDEPTFNQLTLNYQADSDYEAVRADRNITLSTGSNHLKFEGNTEVTENLTTDFETIIDIEETDLALGNNTTGLTINNGAGAVLGTTSVTIDLPQRIDTLADFRAQTLTAGVNNGAIVGYGAIASGYETYHRNDGEQSMCSGNDVFFDVSSYFNSRTTEVHTNSIYNIPEGDYSDLQIISQINNQTLGILDYIDFEYNDTHYKEISYNVNILLALVDTSTGDVYDNCTLNYTGLLILDNNMEETSLFGLNSYYTKNFMGSNLLADSLFRSAKLNMAFGTTPAYARVYPSLGIRDIDATCLQWFATNKSSETPIGGGNMQIIASWKWEFNTLQTKDAFQHITKK